MLIVIAGFPGAVVHAFFAGALLIETISRSMGWGCSSYGIDRQPRLSSECSPTLYIFSLVSLVVGLLSDLIFYSTFLRVDPRIDFETRET